MGDLSDAGLSHGLRDSEEQFRAIFDASPVGSAVVSLDGRLIRVNRALCELLGFAESELVGVHVLTLAHPDEIAHSEHTEADRAHIRQLLEGERDAYEVERRYLSRSGATCWGSVSVTLARDASGEPRHFIAQVADITAAKRTAVGLSEANARLKALLEHSPALISVRGLDGRYLDVNARLARLLGATREQLIGQYPADFSRVQEVLDVATDDRVVWETRRAITREITIRGAGGEDRTYQMVRYPVLDDQGEITAIGSFGFDISDRQRSDRLRQHALEELQEAQRITGVGSWTWDAVTDTAEWSEQLFRIHARDPQLAAPTGHELFRYIVREDRRQVAEAYRHLLAGGGTFEIDYRIVNDDGEERALHAIGRTHTEIPGTYHGTVQDVTRIRAAERDIRAVQQRFQRAFEDTPVGMTVTTPAGSIIQVNDAICRMLGYTAAQLLTLNVSQITYPDEMPQRNRGVEEVLSGEQDHFEVDGRLVRADGSTIWTTRYTAALRDEQGNTPELLTHVVDITERRHLEEELRHLADHDPLTGLLNRRALESQLERHIAHVQRYGDRGALLMLDLDRFKSVNDTLGHQAGDSLLVAAAEMLGRRLRASDSIARLGGDEFAILLPEADAETAERVAREIVAEIEDASTADPVWQSLQVTASIGVRTFTQAITTTRGVLTDADAAMYRAKDAGRNRVAVHPDASEHARQ